MYTEDQDVIVVENLLIQLEVEVTWERLQTHYVKDVGKKVVMIVNKLLISLCHRIFSCGIF